MILKPSFKHCAMEEAMSTMTIIFVYTSRFHWKKTRNAWLLCLKGQREAHSGPLHQGPRKASYVIFCKDPKCVELYYILYVYSALSYIFASGYVLYGSIQTLEGITTTVTGLWTFRLRQ